MIELVSFKQFLIENEQTGQGLNFLNLHKKTYVNDEQIYVYELLLLKIKNHTPVKMMDGSEDTFGYANQTKNEAYINDLRKYFETNNPENLPKYYANLDVSKIIKNSSMLLVNTNGDYVLSTKIKKSNTDFAKRRADQTVGEKQFIPSKFGLKADKQWSLTELKSYIINKIDNMVNVQKEVKDTLLILLEAASNKSHTLPEIKIPKSDLNKISKDFGEILTAIYKLSENEAYKVEFPKGNEKLIDFKIISKDNTVGYSTKSGGGSSTSFKSLEGSNFKNNILAILAGDGRNIDKMLNISKIFLLTPDGASVDKKISNLLKINRSITDLKTKEICDISKGIVSKDNAVEYIKDFYKINFNTRAQVEEGVKKLKMKSAVDAPGIFLVVLIPMIVKYLNSNTIIKQELKNFLESHTAHQININIDNNKINIQEKPISQINDINFGWQGNMHTPTSNIIGFSLKI